MTAKPLPPIPPFPHAAALGVAARRMTGADLAFTETLYISTRLDELAVTDWTDDAKNAFLADQHAKQHHHYAAYYPAALRLILERAGASVGRLYLDDWPTQYRIVDIALVPGQCGAGIGSALLRDVQNLAAAAGKTVSIHVEKMNRARRLYARLGFTLAEDKGVYDLMEWALNPSPL